jgi:hypothetical protein
MVKPRNDGEVFAQLYSTPPRSRLSWRPCPMYSIRRMTPRLYLHLDLLIERRYIDNPPRHFCLPTAHVILFWDYWCAFCLCFCLCLYMGLRWRTPVSWDIVRLAPYQPGVNFFKCHQCFGFATSRSISLLQ